MRNRETNQAARPLGKLARRVLAASAAALLALSAADAQAQQDRWVELRALDGSVDIKGNLLELGEQFYVIETALGVLRIAREAVECIGAACPVIEKYDPKLSIFSALAAAERLLPSLLRGYAENNNAIYQSDAPTNGLQRIDILNAADGALIAEIMLETADTDTALIALVSESAQIAITDRRIVQSDLPGLVSRGVSDLRTPETEALLALDGVVMITHEDNPVRDLSPADVARIWSGEINNWRQLGGGDFPIAVHSYANTVHPNRALFAERVLAGGGRREADGIIRHDREAGLLAAVKADRNAIGIVGRSAAIADRAPMVAVRKPCGLLAPPSDFEIKIGNYPLSRPIYAYTRPDNVHDFARKFLDWVKTAEAQRYVAEAGFADAGIERMRLQDMGVMLIHTAAVEPDFDGNQFATMMRELRGADRLSISFRFQYSGAVLDAGSVENVQDLGERLRARQFDGQEVLLIGFADSEGGSGRNTLLAAQRADVVREILTNSLDIDTLRRLNVSTLSFGEQLPLDCNDTDVGRANNRRVEVWVRAVGGVNR